MRWAAVLAVGLLLLSAVAEVRAQTSSSQAYTVVLRNVPLDLALERLAGATGLNLLYDSRLVDGKDIYCVERDALPEDLLRCVLRGTGLDFYQTSSGTYVLTESAREMPAYGGLAGAIVDEATGEPLPFANVFLADAGVGAAANDAGFFSLSMLKPGPHRVIVSYVGYETKVDSIWVVPGQNTREQFALNSRVLTSEPIVVTGLQQRVPSQALSGNELTGEDLENGPTGFGAFDVARSTAVLPGMTLQEPSADLYLQGGAAGELQMHLDGIPIRNPVTLGHLLGAFSPMAIERMTVHKAGFGVAQGSHLSGSIQAEHALTRAQQRYVTAQFDPLSFNARGQGYWVTGEGLEARAMVAARTSLWTVFRDPTLHHLIADWHVVDPLLTGPIREEVLPSGELRHDGDVAFSDIHAAARLRLDPFHAFQASFYHGHNAVASESIADPSDIVVADSTRPVLTHDSYLWKSRGGQVRYEGLVGERHLATLGVYGSWQTVGHAYQMRDMPQYPGESFYRTGPYDGNWINEMGLRGGLDVNLLKHHTLSGGFKVSYISSRTLVDNHFFRKLDEESAQWQIAGHLQDEVSLGVRTRLELGTRLTYIPDRETLYAEPRLALRHDGEHHKLGEYGVRLAGGVYRQFINQFDLSSTGPTALLPFVRFWLPVDRSHAPPRAYHLAADVLWKPGGPWQFNLEGYYKWQPHLLDIDYPALLNGEGEEADDLTSAEFVSVTRGRAFGGDVRIQYSTSVLRSVLSYSLTRSVRRFPGRFDGEDQPTPWEQPHRVSIENRVAVTPELAALLNWRGIWGRSWALRRAYYDYLGPLSELSGSFPVDLEEPSEQRLPPLYQLDAGLSYERTVGDFAVRVRAEVLNVFNRKNAFDWSLRETEDGFEQLARHLPGRRPAFSVRVSY